MFSPGLCSSNRYVSTSGHNEIYEFGPFRLHTLAWRVERSGVPIHLPRLEFLLLLAFLRQPGAILSKDLLLHQLWPDTAATKASYHALRESVYRLNLLLSHADSGVRFIEYLRGQGYRLCCESHKTA